MPCALAADDFTCGWQAGRFWAFSRIGSKRARGAEFSAWNPVLYYILLLFYDFVALTIYKSLLESVPHWLQGQVVLSSAPIQPATEVSRSRTPPCTAFYGPNELSTASALPLAFFA